MLYGAGAAQAVQPAWPSTPYRYVVVDQDLKVVLQEFGRNVGVRITLSDAVQGRVRGRFPELAPMAFLEHLTRAYGLDWYFDGSMLSISASSEAVTHLVPTHGLSFEQVQGDLDRSGMLDQRFGLRQGPGSGTVVASGPPRYVQLVEQSITVLTAAKAPDAIEPVAPPPTRRTLVIYRGSQQPSVVSE